MVLKLMQIFAHSNKTMIADMPFWRLKSKTESSTDTFHNSGHLFFFFIISKFWDLGLDYPLCYRNLMLIKLPISPLISRQYLLMHNGDWYVIRFLSTYCFLVIFLYVHYVLQSITQSTFKCFEVLSDIHQPPSKNWKLWDLLRFLRLTHQILIMFL